MLGRLVVKRNHEARFLVIDDRGEVVDLEAMRSGERALAFRRHGKMTAGLHEAQRTKDAIDVEISLAPPGVLPVDPFRRMEGEPGDISGDALLEWRIAEQRKHNADSIAATTAPIERWLEAHAATSIQVGRRLPRISARIPTSALEAAFLHEEPAVVQIDLPPPPSKLSMFKGHAAMGEDALVGGACGSGLQCKGLPVDVGIWEGGLAPNRLPTVQNLRFKHHSPVLPPANTGVACVTDNECINFNDAEIGYSCKGPTGGKKCRTTHSSIVAAAVGLQGSYVYPGETDTFAKAGAYDYSRLLFAEDQYSTGLDWLLNQMTIPSYINRSQGLSGGPTSAAHLDIDYAVRNENVTLTIASGNGDPPVSKVDCATWNSICVGAYQVADWRRTDDDRVASFSLYINNPGLGSNVERPHLVGPGQGLYAPDTCTSYDSPTNAMKPSACVTNTTSFPVNGTSFAAPAVLGAAILLHAYAGLYNQTYWDALSRKAVLMAGATDANADGPIPVAGVDGKDGAGAPAMSRVKRIVDSGNVRRPQLTPALTAGGALVTVATVAVPLGKTLRVAAAWNSCALAFGGATNTLADFDLVVERSCGTLSATGTGEVEMLMSFSCPLRGQTNQTIKLRQKAGTTWGLCGGEAFEPVVVAWDLF